MPGYTANQVRRMAAHIEGCAECGDDEIRAALYDESQPPEDLAQLIATTHADQWREFLARHR